MKHAYQSARKRLLLFDYDGTLAPIVPLPQDARPDEDLRSLLRQLCADTRNDVVVISGRTGKELEQWLSDIPVVLVAEHGKELKLPGKRWHALVRSDTRFLKDAKRLLSGFAARLPGSFVERKPGSVVWHTRAADIARTDFEVQKALPSITRLAAQNEARLLMGKRVVEILQRSVNKGLAADYLLSLHAYDFVLAAGDDLTDEPMFARIGKIGFTVKIGPEKTAARMRIADPLRFRSHLRFVMGLWTKFSRV